MGQRGEYGGDSGFGVGAALVQIPDLPLLRSDFQLPHCKGRIVITI